MILESQNNDNQFNGARDEVKTKNACVFFLIKLFNTVLLISSIGLIGLSIWLWRYLRIFSMMELFFLALGLFELILVIIAYTSRKSIRKLNCYIITLGILFIGELVITIFAFAFKNKIIYRIAKATDTEREVNILKQHYSILTYYVAGSLVIILILIALSCYYVESLKNKNFAFDYNVLDRYGKLITGQENDKKKKKEIIIRQKLYTDYNLN